jgi:DNA-binding CsgD family transcriptional regulator
VSAVAPSVVLPFAAERRPNGPRGLRLADASDLRAAERLDGQPADALLRAVAGSLAAALAQLAAAWGERLAHDGPEESLGAALARERDRLGLTAREAEVLALVAGGLTNREIADHLVISVRTAEHHVAHILRKLRAPSRREAARLARRLARCEFARPLPGV